jgi:general secretion pathway protein K
MTSRRQQGAALILAILVVAIASTIAVFMAGQQSMWTEQAGNLVARSQNNALAHAAIDWARGILAQDVRNSKVDHLGEAWAKPLAALPVESANIGGAIHDQQGLFNLNNLVHNGRDSEADIALFKRLLTQLQLPTDLVNPLLDWIDADSTVHAPGGAEDADYLLGEPPYRCANQALVSVDELYRVRGFNRANIERLKPFVTALLERTTINVNTAPREILSALLPDLAETDISSVLENRKAAFFNSKQDFRSRLPQATAALRDDAFDVTSNYFLVDVMVRSSHADAAYEALLARTAVGGWPSIVWQRQLVE